MRAITVPYTETTQTGTTRGNVQVGTGHISEVSMIIRLELEEQKRRRNKLQIERYLIRLAEQKMI